MFGERLKEARVKKGVSQEKLAEMLFVSRQAVAKWESNQNEPSIDTIVKISEILSVDLNYLLTGKGNIRIESETNATPTSVTKNDDEKYQTVANFSNSGTNYKTVSLVFIILQYVAGLFLGIFFPRKRCFWYRICLGTIYFYISFLQNCN